MLGIVKQKSLFDFVTYPVHKNIANYPIIEYPWLFLLGTGKLAGLGNEPVSASWSLNGSKNPIDSTAKDS